MNKLKIIGWLAVLMPMVLMAQHSITGTFSPPEQFQVALLYKVLPLRSDYMGNARVDGEGRFSFELDSTAKAGMYRVVYGFPQEENNFDVIYNGKENIRLNYNTETGIEYLESMENSLLRSYSNSMSLVSQSIGNFYSKQSTDSTALTTIFKTQKETQENYEKISEGTIASNFIRANRPYIPEGYEDISTYISNLKAHFFDAVDFNNETLQSSQFLIERILNYVFGMVSGEDDEMDSYKRNIDAIYAAMEGADPGIRKYLLDVLWYQMADAHLDEAANYLSDGYLMALARALEDHGRVEELRLFKSLSLGHVAPDISWTTEAEGVTTTTSLSGINSAQKYVLVFWSSTCSHCLEEIPQLKSFLDNMEECNLQVVAIGLEDSRLRWDREILKYPDFIHVYGAGKWENDIAKRYNIKSTPTYFVLDADKKIIAKPDSFEDLKKELEDSHH